MAKRALSPEEIAAAARLASAIAASGKSQEAIGADVGVSQGMVWQWAKARMAVPAPRALKLAEAVGLTDPGEISPAWRLAGLGHHHTTPTTTAPFLRPISVWEDAADLPPDQYVFFPKLDHRWSCGTGGPDHSQIEQTDKTIPFTADWAKRMGWSPRTHFTMRAAGESMEPTIQDKAPVVIDTSEAGRNVRSGKVYAITVNGEPLLKRLDKLPGGRLRVRSDNQAPAYAAFEVADGDIEVIGRAVWTPVQL